MPGSPDDDCTLEELSSDERRPSDHDDIHIVLECDRLLAGSTRHCIDDVEQVVFRRGRERRFTRDSPAPVRTLVIEVPDSRMSAQHAAMRRAGDHWLLEDADSRNGTYVQGRRITRARLTDGAVVQLGHTHLLFRTRDLPRALLVGPRDVASASAREAALGVLSHERAALVARMVDAARGDVPILLLGEAGSGKDRMARIVHEVAGNQGPLVVVQCLLVGRTPGADGEGDAGAELRSAFARAAGGTLFLDEIEGLSLPAQVALLSLLRSPARARIASLVSSVRSSERAPLVPHVAADLLAELAVFAMQVPPLRDRREDMGALVAEIVRRGDGTAREPLAMDPITGQAFMHHDWPYNVSELESCMRSALATTDGGRMHWSPASMHHAPLAPVDPEEPTPPPRALRVSGDASQVTPAEPDPDFAAHVRRALKCNLSVSGLQKNALLGSRMVLGATKGSSAAASTVPALRTIVLSALEVLAASSPRGAKQAGVLRLTFVEPTATQQEAADRLGMAFGTYRRYVTSALAELTSLLWFRELSARDGRAVSGGLEGEEAPISSAG